MRDRPTTGEHGSHVSTRLTHTVLYIKGKYACVKQIESLSSMHANTCAGDVDFTSNQGNAKFECPKLNGKTLVSTDIHFH